MSPRAGFAWSPLNNRRTVVRGGFGIFYDRVPLRALANALLSSGNTTNITSTSQLSVSLSPTQTGAPVFPNVLSSVPGGVLVNFSTMNPNMQNAYSEQGSFEIEHQIGANSTFTVGYQHLRGVRLIVSVNQNVPACVAAGTNNGCRPNPNFANNSQYSPIADSHYDALQVSFVQRPVKWGNYRVSYSYSKALDDVGGEFFFSSPIVPTNIWHDYGRSDDDQRHRVVVDGSLHLPYAFEWSGSMQYYSALPFNVVSGVTTLQGTAGRPIVNGDVHRTQHRHRPDFFGVNTRVSRTFKVGDRMRVQAIAEAFNVLNHRNNLGVNGTFGAGAYPSAPNSTFGQVTAASTIRARCSSRCGCRFDRRDTQRRR